MAAGDAAGVEVRDVLAAVAYRADQIALHDLHVIDVVQELHARRSDGFHDGDAERRSITLVILVIDLAVEQLQTDRDAVIFGSLFDAVEGIGAVGGRLLVGHPAAVAEEGNEVGHLVRRRERDPALEALDDLCVVRLDVEAVGNRAAESRAHRAGQPVFTGDRPLGFGEQIHGREAHIGNRAAEVGQVETGSLAADQVGAGGIHGLSLCG